MKLPFRGARISLAVLFVSAYSLICSRADAGCQSNDLCQPAGTIDDRWASGYDGERILFHVEDPDCAGENYALCNALEVYRNVAGTWTFETLLRAPAQDRAAGIYLGAGGSISGDVIVTGYAKQGTQGWGPEAGRVYIFRFGGTVWNLETTLFSPNPGTALNFGSDATVHGDYLAVTAFCNGNDCTGAIYGFWFDGAQWSSGDLLQTGGWSFGGRAVGDGMIIVSEFDADLPGCNGCGIVYAYQHTGGGLWAEMPVGQASDPVAGRRLGLGLDLNGDLLAIGTEIGKLYVFRNDGSAWNQEALLEPSIPVLFDRIAISNDIALFGGYQSPIAIFQHDGTNWIEHGFLQVINGRHVQPIELTGHALTANVVVTCGPANCNYVGFFDLDAAGPDCDCDGTSDNCELANGLADDCNANGAPDNCDIADGISTDCNGNSFPDECELVGEDCDGNGTLDECDLAGGAPDCNVNSILDSCEGDCNGNGVPDDCDVASGTSPDADNDGIPDECCPAPCGPYDPLLLNPFGTCSNAGNAVCDVNLNNCSAGTCEPCGQVRYLSFKVPATTAGRNTAIRIRLDSLHHPTLPPIGALPVYNVLEGQNRYLNTLPNTLSRCCNPNSNPTSCNTSVSCNSNADCAGLGLNTTCYSSLCPDSTAYATFFRCARVGCSPEYRDWSDFAGLVTYATGDAVIPSSIYSATVLEAFCAGNEPDCLAASAALTVTTERWGNVDCSNANFGVPGAADVGRSVDKVKDASGAFIKPRVHIRTPTLDPMSAVAANDIGRIVDAIKGLQYPFNIKCTTATPCTTNAECVVPATCSANGRCTTAKDTCTGLCQP